MRIKKAENRVDLIDTKEEYDVSVRPFGTTGFIGSLKNDKFETRFWGTFNYSNLQTIDIHFRLIGISDAPKSQISEIKDLIHDVLILRWPIYRRAGLNINYLFRGAK